MKTRRQGSLALHALLSVWLAAVGCESAAPTRDVEASSPGPRAEGGTHDGREQAIDVGELAKAQEDTADPTRAARVRRQQIDRLKPVYAGQISANANREEIPTNIARMSSLMAEWNPIHSSVRDLEALIGEPTRRTNGSLVYEFDTGLGGVVWRFGVRNETVIAVEFDGID